MKTVYLIIGAIGSGKSVISDFLLSIPQLEGLEYIGFDIYKKLFFDFSIENDKRGYRCADELFFYRLEQLCKLNSDFVFELCPTNGNKIEKIKYLISKYEYNIITIYVGIDDVTINIRRCKQRETEGYDYVHERKIKRRFLEAQKGLFEFLYISKVIYFVDNSNEYPSLIAKYWNKEYCLYKSNCQWFNDNIGIYINK